MMKRNYKINKFFKNFLTNLKQMNNKRTKLIKKDIVLMTRVRIFCTTLFTNNKKKSCDSNAYLSDGSCSSGK